MFRSLLACAAAADSAATSLSSSSRTSFGVPRRRGPGPRFGPAPPFPRDPGGVGREGGKSSIPIVPSSPWGGVPGPRGGAPTRGRRIASEMSTGGFKPPPGLNLPSAGPGPMPMPGGGGGIATWGGAALGGGMFLGGGGTSPVRSRLGGSGLRSPPPTRGGGGMLSGGPARGEWDGRCAVSSYRRDSRKRREEIQRSRARGLGGTHSARRSCPGARLSATARPGTGGARDRQAPPWTGRNASPSRACLLRVGRAVTRPLSRWASGEINKSRFLRAPVAWSGLVGRSARALFACASCGVQSTKTRRRRRAGRCTRGGCAAMPVPRRTKNLTLSPHLFVTSKLVKPKNGKCGKMEIVFIIDSPH